MRPAKLRRFLCRHRRPFGGFCLMVDVASDEVALVQARLGKLPAGVLRGIRPLEDGGLRVVCFDDGASVRACLGALRRSIRDARRISALVRLMAPRRHVRVAS